MPKDLERDLGLYATLTVSLGAMIGSGIFVLPGLASAKAGPAVVVAYLLAGLLVLPAGLSKAEMATAMPEAGGTYLYIDRAMGPLPGTVAGVGAWFSLVFKSAFALAGLGAYLAVFVDLPSALAVKIVAIGVALALLVVNVVGVKQSGRLQAWVVSLVLVALAAFVATGLTNVDQAQYDPFFPKGAGGVLAATGFVFVSYAGVTKIASVAEEVEDPGRNIPIGILGSILLMMLVYTLVVFVVVGVVPASLGAELQVTKRPMALAAGAFLGEVGRATVAVVAVLALTSMANAGILSSSRFPLAMSRDSLAPAVLSGVSERFNTPVYAIGLTGTVLVVLIAFVPVVELAKLASAFQILVFVFVNAAVVAFRESELDAYDPEFVAPAYPWVQILGILGGVLLLTQMGLLPLVGAVGLVVAGAVWYRLYGRDRTEREGAALDAIRRSSADRAIERTRAICERGGPDEVLIPVGDRPSARRRREVIDLVQLGADVADPDGVVRVVRFEEVPEQLDLEAARDQSPAEVEFEAEDGYLVSDLDPRVEFGEIVTHDTQRAVANVARHYEVDLVLGGWHPRRWRSELLGTDVDWYMRNVGTDLAFVRNRGYADVAEIAVVANEGPFDPLEVVVADRIATESGARIHFVAALDEASEDQVGSTRDYLEALSSLCRANTEVTVATGADRLDGLVRTASEADLTVVGTSAHHVVYDVLFGTVQDRLVERLDHTVVLTHSARPRRHTFVRAILERLLY